MTGRRRTRGVSTRHHRHGRTRIEPPRRSGGGAVLAAATVMAAIAACDYPAAPGSGVQSPVHRSAAPNAEHDTVQTFPPAGSCHYRTGRDGNRLPDPRCTPGAANPQVTTTTLSKTICRAGYTGAIRPPETVTAAEKRASAAAYGYRGSLAAAELDHLVPEEIGGAANDPRNLWVEPETPGFRPHGYDRNPKDAVEYTLRGAVCAGRVTLAAAQAAITADWTTALSVLHLDRSTGRP